MIFVMGGAYQGKTEFVKKKYLANSKSYIIIDIKNINIKDINEKTIIIDNIHNEVKSEEQYKKVKNKVEQLLQLKEKQVIIIGQIMGSGVVPIEEKMRVWRDNVGFMYQYISKNSREVYRLWCGIPQKLK